MTRGRRPSAPAPPAYTPLVRLTGRGGLPVYLVRYDGEPGVNDVRTPYALLYGLPDSPHAPIAGLNRQQLQNVWEALGRELERRDAPVNAPGQTTIDDFTGGSTL